MTPGRSGFNWAALACAAAIIVIGLWLLSAALGLALDPVFAVLFAVYSLAVYMIAEL